MSEKTIEKADIVVSESERTWAMAAHLSALAQFIIPVFGSIIGPLVVWLIKKDTMPFVDDQGKEVLNFNISMLIYWVISAILMIVMIGMFLMFALFVFWLVFTIIGAVKAHEGTRYRYPLTIRFLK